MLVTYDGIFIQSYRYHQFKFRIRRTHSTSILLLVTYFKCLYKSKEFLSNLISLQVGKPTLNIKILCTFSFTTFIQIVQRISIPTSPGLPTICAGKTGKLDIASGTAVYSMYTLGHGIISWEQNSGFC